MGIRNSSWVVSVLNVSFVQREASTLTLSFIDSYHKNACFSLMWFCAWILLENPRGTQLVFWGDGENWLLIQIENGKLRADIKILILVSMKEFWLVHFAFSFCLVPMNNSRWWLVDIYWEYSCSSPPLSLCVQECEQIREQMLKYLKQ